MISVKTNVLFLIISCCYFSSFAQQLKDSLPKKTRPEPKSFSEFYNANTKVDSGLINVYRQEDKYFFEIPHQLFGRDILMVSRIAKGAADTRDYLSMAGYAGDEINNVVLRFDRGPGNKLFLKRISYSDYSMDSTRQMYQAVQNNNLQPIVASFDITALSKDYKGCLIDVTDYLNGDNDVIFFKPNMKIALQIGGIQPDRSYIESVRSYPLNAEIRTVKTYSRSSGGSIFGGPVLSSSATLELNSSFVILPANVMQPRYGDARVGYFSMDYIDFDNNPQGVEKLKLIKRWRLTPRSEDMEKYFKRELVEPEKPIVFYIDPATPKKWVPYLIQGVNDWQKAFERAGFKKAIYAREAPKKEEDSTWSLEDARFSAIVYKPSEIANASGPSIADPRTGEILESHINWYHNVMELVHDWYMIQAGPNDPQARKMEFSDSLMGHLIRFVSCHEVGHALGLLHNFGSSSTVPVDSLRNKAWVEVHGHTPSIMDYARFNYVAQPEDQISAAGIFPRLGEYDFWAIEWGYRIFQKFSSPVEEKKRMNQWVISKSRNKRLWFGSERSLYDPRSQYEDLGDDPVKASGYGIKNLQYILPRLKDWTQTSDEGYSNLKRIYRQVINQYALYIGHVAKNIAGEYYDPKTTEEAGPVYSFVPRITQQKAIEFLQQQLFLTPDWLVRKDILALVGMDPVEIVGKVQNSYLNKLFSPDTILKLINVKPEKVGENYTALDLFRDLKKGIWSELYSHRPIDVYRRNLQKQYIGLLLRLSEVKPVESGGDLQLPAGFRAVGQVDPGRSDISSISRAQLLDLRNDIKAALPFSKDAMDRYHFQDLLDRINNKFERKQ